MTSIIERRQFLVGGGALAIAGTALAAQPRHTPVDFSRRPLGTLVPLSVGAWMGSDDADVVPEQVDGSIDHGQTVSRRYVADGAPGIMLVVSYHGPQSPDLKVHRPETCYAVAGFEGAAPVQTAVAVAPSFEVPSVLFTATRERRIETVLYWTRVGNRFPQTLRDQRIDFLTEALRGVLADGLLLRASAIGDNIETSAASLRLFVASLVRSASPEGRKLLLGTSVEAVHQS